MLVSIHFCARCGYEPRAVALAAEIREHFPDADIELVPRSDGELDVKRDGTAVYERAKAGRFPGAGEIVALLGRQRADR